MGIGRLRATWIGLFCLIALGIASAGSVQAERLDGSDHGGRSLFTELIGAEEAPGPGDPDGTGTALITLNLGQGTVCFELTVENITLPTTGAHIHRAPAGSPGPIVVPLTAPGTSGASSGCVSDISRTLIKEILQNPEEFYVNVHTLPDFGPGAVRGQLG